MDKYLCIGVAADTVQLTLMSNNGFTNISSYLFQRKLIEGIESNGVVVDILCGHVVSAFPKYKSIVMPRRSWECGNGSSNIDVHYLNLPLINRVTKALSLTINSIKWAQRYKAENKKIFVLSAHTPFLLVAFCIKRFYKNTRVLTLVGDLPEYMDPNMSTMKKLFKKMDRVIVNHFLVKTDCMVCSAAPIYEKIPTIAKEHNVLDGVINFNEQDYIERIMTIDFLTEKKIILLSGALELSDGVGLLLKSFATIKDDNFELWLTEFGNATSMIEDYAKKIVIMCFSIGFAMQLEFCIGSN